MTTAFTILTACHERYYETEYACTHTYMYTKALGKVFWTNIFRIDCVQIQVLRYFLRNLNHAAIKSQTKEREAILFCVVLSQSRK